MLRRASSAGRGELGSGSTGSVEVKDLYPAVIVRSCLRRDLGSEEGSVNETPWESARNCAHMLNSVQREFAVAGNAPAQEQPHAALFEPEGRRAI